MADKCKKCVRYNPKGVSNCLLNTSKANLEKKYKYVLEVADCGLYEAPKKVFKKPAPKPTVEQCECENDKCECEVVGNDDL
jgi:hypothetical protein